MEFKADVSCLLPDRLRLRIAAKRGDVRFFTDLKARWLAAYPQTQVAANEMTASLLVTGPVPQKSDIAEFGRQSALFSLEAPVPQLHAWSREVQTGFTTLNNQIQRLTSGSLNLTNGLFLALVIFGLIELIRGNWKSPPWYTAFWYAFGVYSKSLIDQASDLN